MNFMTENVTEENSTQNPNKKWMLWLILALLALVVFTAIILRRSPRQTSLAGREVPTVEQVAGREVPSVESISGKTSDNKADLTLAPEMVARIKLQYAEVKTQTIVNQLRTTGTVQANAYKETRVFPLVGGRVTVVRVQLGDVVRKGQTLATIFSTDLAQEQMEYLKVDANLQLHVTQSERYQKLAELGAVSQQENQEVEARLREHHAEHASHRQKLKLLGMTDAQIADLKDASQVKSEVNVPAPSSGVVTVRSVNTGQVVTTADSLFSVTDLSTVWVIANVFEKDFGVMQAGAKVNFTTSSYPNRNFSGTISYLDPRVDSASRTAQVRLEVANPNQMLKLGMFVDVALDSAGSQESTVIPKAAVQSIGNDQVIFVSLGGGQFQMRKLQLGEDAGDSVRVMSGVTAGEKIVTEGSFFLRAEMGRR